MIYKVIPNQKYIVAQYINNRIKFKEIIAKEEVCNFKKGQMEIISNKNKHYPFYCVYENIEEAKKKEKKFIKDSIFSYKKKIKQYEKEIRNIYENIQCYEIILKNFK